MDAKRLPASCSETYPLVTFFCKSGNNQRKKEVWLRNKSDSAMHPGYMVLNLMPVDSPYFSANALMSSMLHSLASLYALAPMNRLPSIIAPWLRSLFLKAFFKPDMSPSPARGGT